MIASDINSPEHYKELFGTLSEYQDLLRDYKKLYSVVNMLIDKFPEIGSFLMGSREVVK